MRTRIAPTPSGFLHLGNVFSFALTAALARRSGASILLRIDDLDRERSRRAYVDDIFDTLTFMGIPWDEGPRNAEEFENAYSQAFRMDAYRDVLDRLSIQGALFACTCSRADTGPCSCVRKGIPLGTDGVSWRLHAEDIELKNFVVRRKDGIPAYQVTSVVDDLRYGVDLVVRGEDLRPSTEAQRFLAAQLGEGAFGKITFHHHPLLQGPSGEKLSKSAGAASIRYLRTLGLSARDVYGRIGELLGAPSPPATWEELAEMSRS